MSRKTERACGRQACSRQACSRQAESSNPGKTSKLSVEIFRLMRAGDAKSRDKALELLKSAMSNPLEAR